MIAHPNDLIYFVEVANTLNFSRASKHIGISQPSLSIAVKRLEQAVGTSLFIRTKTGVVLTKAGKKLLSQTNQLLQLWDSIKAASLSAHYEIEGSFTLGVHPSVALYTLSRFLPALLAQYPKLEIKLKHDLSRIITEEIINLSIDIGLVVNPMKQADLIIHKLYDDKVAFWQLSNKKILEQLYKGDAILIMNPELLQTQWLLKRIAKLGVTFKRLITSNNLEVIADLTESGVGIGILPTSVVLSSPKSKLTLIPKMPTYHDEICLVYRHENREIKSIKAIVKAIKNSFLAK